MDQTVKLMYFKDTGKYYSSGEYISKKKHIYDVVDEVRAMKKHPDLVGKWNYGIIIEFQGVPHLIQQS